MGDRAQLEITNGNQSVYLYTHWAGSDLPEILHAGLSLGINGGRTIDGDPAYALGCIVRSFVEHTGGVGETTGFGVGFKAGDNDGDDRILTLDVSEGMVGTNGTYVPVKEFLADIKSVPWSEG